MARGFLRKLMAEFGKLGVPMASRKMSMMNRIKTSESVRAKRYGGMGLKTPFTLKDAERNLARRARNMMLSKYKPKRPY